MDVRMQNNKKKPQIMGTLSYDDPTAGFSFSSSKITTLTFNRNQAHLTGTAKVSKKSQISFSVDVTDNGSLGTNDFFSIQLSNGYSASGNLVTGDITID
jgi:hypothetical protein